MDISNKNKKVALKRWNNFHEKEKENFNHNLILKARICGYLAGDGSIIIRKDNNNKLHYIIKFAPDHESLIKPFSNAFKIVYNKEPKIIKYNKYYVLVYYSKSIVEDLLKITKFGVLKWRVPFEILITKEAKVEWLKAFFDSEAYVNEKYIKIQSVSKGGIKDIKSLLLDFGIYAKEYEYQPKNPKWNKVYMLFINKKSERIKFLNEISFNHLAKLAKLEHAAIA